MSVHDILSQVFAIMHIYIHYTYKKKHAHTLKHPHTYTHKVFLAVYYSCHLVISGYHKS